MNEKWLNDVKFALVGLRWFAEDLEGNIEYLGQLIQAFQRDPSSDREQRIRNEFDSYGLLAPRRNPKRAVFWESPDGDAPPRSMRQIGASIFTVQYAGDAAIAWINPMRITWANLADPMRVRGTVKNDRLLHQ